MLAEDAVAVLDDRDAYAALRRMQQLGGEPIPDPVVARMRRIVSGNASRPSTSSAASNLFSPIAASRSAFPLLQHSGGYIARGNFSFCRICGFFLDESVKSG